MQLINIIQSNKIRFKKGNPNPNSRGIKRSHSSRSLCFVPRFQSVVPSSVFVRLATRSLPFIRRGYFYFFRLISCSAIALPFSDEKKQTAPCVLAVALPPAINLNRNARKGLILIICSANASLFRLPFHAPIPTLHCAKASLRSRSRVAVSDRNTATRSQKKKLSTWVTG
jgi:hypothetical protein